MLRCCSIWVFFFFQAEDGIRDDLVTGVQTCALPISSPGYLKGRTPPADPSGLAAFDGSVMRSMHTDRTSVVQVKSVDLRDPAINKKKRWCRHLPIELCGRPIPCPCAPIPRRSGVCLC